MSAEFIFEEAPFDSCHATTIVETQPGRLLAAWFGGTKEGAPDVAIWLARFDGRWSPPEKVAEEKNVPCWNPVLFRQRKSGQVSLFYKIGRDPMSWSGFYRRSTDDGATFGEQYILPAGILGPIKNKAIELADGTILAPTSVESYHAWSSWVERSVDGGRNWTRQGPIAHREEPMGVIQPTILRRADGSLFMLMRATSKIGQICRSESRDGGLTWTSATPIAELPNPNSGIDAVTLADGRHALVYNPTHKGRTPLILSLSADDGQTWKLVKTLEDEPGEYSYPAIIQAADSALHITYTWKRVRVRHWRLELSELLV